MVAKKPWDDLTSRQRTFAEHLVLGDENGESFTKVDLCNKLGIPRSTAYEWLKLESMQRYMEYLSTARIKTKLSDYDKKLEELIFNNPRGPSVKALEIVYRRVGGLKDNTRMEVEVETDNDMSNKSNEQLMSEIEELKKLAGRDEET